MIFFVRLISSIFELFPPLYWDSKAYPIGTVLSLGLANIFTEFWIKVFFECFTDWNRRCDRNRIIIFFLTCKFCIDFIHFLSDITCSLWLMIPVYIAQLFNKILGCIEGLLLFLAILSQLNYLFVHNFKLSLQNITIWKIRSTSIFQIF